MLLAIDTSTNWASMALLDDGVPIVTHHWAIGQQHSTQIFGGIDTLLQKARASQSAVTAVAVATGPGSFNGTRVAVTTAKTLAFVWNVPLIGITSLAGLAEAAVAYHQSNLTEWHATVLALLEAGRDQLYTCWYDLKRTGEEMDWHVQPRGPITIERVDALSVAAPTRNIIVCGEYSVAHVQALVESFGADRLVGFGDISAPDRAIGIGRLAHLRLAAGERDDPLALEPTYVRPPNITTSTRHPIPGAP